jgi:hypothetical protein
VIVIHESQVSTALSPPVTRDPFRSVLLRR